MNISIGRIVHYVLSAEDAEKVNRRRTGVESIAERLKIELAPTESGKIAPFAWPAGAQAHIGNSVKEGQECPAMCVATFGEVSGSNFQVFLDGTDVYWATSRHEDTNTDKKLPPTPGTWHFPVRD